MFPLLGARILVGFCGLIMAYAATSQAGGTVAMGLVAGGLGLIIVSVAKFK
jgi:hypothetical protein